ncbi:chemotaxis protein [Hylemonella gracilis str. Niagara R]|uniref:Chemotaxis protein n=1 Tax=Hylemonella gracilis str. Niagara R TaxID=1458275 RepID=A0A016XJ13_9BURK|nr:LysE family transporter [Hylemonella gracilis]EYC51851.1 chemotaxis protein [Hylemonella gracilis str. Niagara R]
MFALFLTALLLGFVFNAAPGAVFAETIRRGLRGGYRGALLVQVGSLTGDALWAVLGLVGVGLLARTEVLRTPVALAGIAYLLWLAYDAWRASRAVTQERDAAPAAVDVPDPAPALGELSCDAERDAEREALRAGALLSLTNPHNVAYWAALGSAMGAAGVSDPRWTDYAIFFTGFMVSSVVWCFVCAALVARVFAGANDRWARWTHRACALAFLLLALSSARSLAGH